MAQRSLLCCLVAAVLLLLASRGAEAVVWGTNIHFTQGRPGEVEQLGRAYRIARMDFAWGATERTRGQYAFDQYDGLLRDLEVQRVLPYWILDYGNPLYDNGHPPTTPDAVQAYANWAVAAMQHFKGHNVTWEVWNEPNGNWFWNPVNATAYSVLVAAVGKLKAQNADLANERIIGPATSTIDLKYLEACFQNGVLNYFSAVSVHPYRPTAPETVLPEYAQLRALIAKYSPRPSDPQPIISGEWGWATCQDASGAPINCGLGRNSETDQAKYLARQWLLNAAEGIPVSVYYDFIDDGTNSSYSEHNFGTMHHDYINATVAHLPKPAYTAAQTLQDTVNPDARTEVSALSFADAQTYGVVFANPDKASDIAIAVWKLSGTPLSCGVLGQQVDCGYSGITEAQCEQRGCCWQTSHPGPECYTHSVNTTGLVSFRPPAAAGPCFTAVGFLGEALPQACRDSQGLVSVTTSDAPVLLVAKNQPSEENDNE